MAKTAISTRLDEYIFRELDELSTARGISPSALIREFVIAGLEKQNSLTMHFDDESAKIDRLDSQLKLIADTVLGTLYHIVAYQNPDAQSQPSREKTEEIISLGTNISKTLLESRA